MLLCCSAKNTRAQNPINTFTSATYIGGYHIKCYGQSTGSIQAQPSFGTAPYTFLWSSGETSAQINNKPAGIYIVTMTDSINVSHSDTFELRQPNALNYQSTLSDYYGYNIHTHNGNSGSIQLSGAGGTPPYTYLWSNGDNLVTRNGLTAGNYSFSITDANQCSTNGNVTLTAPTPIQLSFNNVQNTQCDRSEDGAATLNMSGGLGNFSVVWSNGSFSLSPNDLPAGYNEVRIYEQGRAVIDTGVTINAPQPLALAFTLSQYNNGYQVSCVDCYNGNITTTVTGGTAPYTYLWEDENSSTTANLSNLNGGEYNLSIIDAHGCKTSDVVTLKMPSPKDWSRFGNSNIDTTEFIGSTDTSALVFKTNSQEALRIRGNGNVGVGTSSPTEKLEVVGDLKVNGEIKIGSLGAISYNDGAGIRGYKFEDFSNLLNIGNIQPTLPSCMSNLPNLYNSFTGFLRVTHPTLSTTTTTYIGNDAQGGIIESASDIGSNSALNLKINYFCGNDVLIGNNSSGNLIANNKLGIGVSSPNEKLEVDGSGLFSGKIGIGVTTPNEKLEVNGNTLISGMLGIATTNPQAALHIKDGISNSIILENTQTQDKLQLEVTAGTSNIISKGGLRLYVNSEEDPSNTSASFIVIKNAKSYLQTPTRQELFKIQNDGTGFIQDLWVKAVASNGAFPDYVFAKDYKLKSLAEVKAFYQKHQHLPGMPSAKEIEVAGGASMSQMLINLTKIVEENTIYLTQQDEQIKQLQAENLKLKKSIEKLTKK